MTRSLLRTALCMVLLLASGSGVQAQRRREPLTDTEIVQIRDASWEPGQRLTLYVQFTRARLVKLEEMRSNPKTTERPRRTHDMLDDLRLLYDELNDNIDTYVDRKDDIRKPLKIIIDADTEFQAKLRALKDAADIPAQEYAQYEFVLTDLLDTVDTSTEEHRKLLADQELEAKHKKLNSNSSAKPKPE
jgi:chromosome segregation ATPase